MRTRVEIDQLGKWNNSGVDNPAENPWDCQARTRGLKYVECFRLLVPNLWANGLSYKFGVHFYFTNLQMNHLEKIYIFFYHGGPISEVGSLFIEIFKCKISVVEYHFKRVFEIQILWSKIYLVPQRNLRTTFGFLWLSFWIDKR